MPTTTQAPKQGPKQGAKRAYTRADAPPRRDCPECHALRLDVERVTAAARRCVDDCDALIADRNAVILEQAREIDRLRAVVWDLKRRVAVDLTAQEAAQRDRCACDDGRQPHPGD